MSDASVNCFLAGQMGKEIPESRKKTMISFLKLQRMGNCRIVGARERLLKSGWQTVFLLYGALVS
jgi:hypothetical protein